MSCFLDLAEAAFDDGVSSKGGSAQTASFFAFFEVDAELMGTPFIFLDWNVAELEASGLRFRGSGWLVCFVQFCCWIFLFINL